MQSSSHNIRGIFVFGQEIAERRKPYTDDEYTKNCFINEPELFHDFKNKVDIIKIIIVLPFPVKTIKMCSNMTTQHIEHLKMDFDFINSS